MTTKKQQDELVDDAKWAAATKLVKAYYLWNLELRANPLSSLEKLRWDALLVAEKEFKRWQKK